MQAPLIKIVSIFLAFIAFALSAQAIEVEVKVFEKGINAMEARSKALADAEKRGFTALVKQKSPEDAEQIIKDYKGYDISRYIVGYHAKNEVVTDTSYRAVLIMDFDDSFISSAVHNTSTQKTEQTFNTPQMATGDAILIIPVFRSPRGLMLWENGNTWRKYVNEMVLQLGDGKFVVPYGDQTDKLSVNASNILNASFARLAPLARRYGANRTLVATAHERGANGYGLTLRELSPNGDAVKTIHIKPETGMNSNDLLHKAAEELISGYLNKRQQELHPEDVAQYQQHDIQAFISLNSTRDWAEIRKRLRSIKMIKDMQVIGADANKMIMSINFQGSPKQLGQSLLGNGIAAQNNNDQLWLSLR